MIISLMNIKICFQKNIIASDAIGNRVSEWVDYYSCHATGSGENSSQKGAEDETAGITAVHPSIDFTVRWCKALSDITTDHYRIIFNGDIYNIIGIDHMNFKKKSLKFRCRREER